MGKIVETLQTPIQYSCDVLVCGGGVGGIAAALAAARSGKKVLLTERGFMLGGLATAGLITIYLPLCDGLGRQVSFGLAEELLRLSVQVWNDGDAGYRDWIAAPATPHSQTSPRYLVNFNPQLFAISAQRLLLEEGVQLLYGTTAVAASTENEKISAVIFENKSGRFAISAQSVVDATGDADIAVYAGAPTVNFGQGNLLAAWYYYSGERGFGVKPQGASDIPDGQKTGKNEVPKLSEQRFGGLDGQEISQFVCMSHDQVLQDVLRQRAGDRSYQPATIATVPQLRMTRRVDGAYTLDDSESHTYFADSVGMVSDWRRRGPVYEVPFGTLYSARVRNLVFAGRVTSVTDAMWDIMRVIPCCAVTGEAAGVAAAMTDDMTALDVAALQAELTSRGVVLHESDLK